MFSFKVVSSGSERAVQFLAHKSTPLEAGQPVATKTPAPAMSLDEAIVDLADKVNSVFNLKKIEPKKIK